MEIGTNTLKRELERILSKPRTVKQIARELDIPARAQSALKKSLKELVDEGELIELKRKKYGIPEKMGMITGYLQRHRMGYGFVVPDKGGVDVYVSAEDMGAASHGDRVMVQLYGHLRTKKLSGRIIRIIKRARETIVGMYLLIDGETGIVIPDDERLAPLEMFIPSSKANGAKHGQKVVAEITQWPSRSTHPQGEVIDILGYPDEPGVDILCLIKEYELPVEFSPEALGEVDKLPDRVTSTDIEGRMDLRDITCITIDPKTAKDFDDAVSIERSDDGDYRLGVHIADVSHYVAEGGAIDRDAYERGTSVYLIDRAIPMLPEKLSSHLCSLIASEDRLAMSVIMRIDSQGSVKSHKIALSVINVKKRFTYEEVQKILDREDPTLVERNRKLLDYLDTMLELSLVLNRKRGRRGSLDLDIPEVEVTLDDRGRPIKIYEKKRLASHRLIEEFMLIANETIASHITRMHLPFLYRIHEKPDPEKILELHDFIRAFGYHTKKTKKVSSRALQSILEKAKGKPEEKLINMLILRSLKQARYSEINAGHFGLATDRYTHFTSPIRRYPDLVVHRIVRQVSRQGFPSKEKIRRWEEMLPPIAERTSERERIAVEVERESVEMKKIEFLEDMLGEVLSGTISQVMPFGFFVELDNLFVEGLVHVESLADDYYVFYEKHLALIGEHNKRRFRLGDRVKVQVARVNKEERKIDLVLVSGYKD